MGKPTNEDYILMNAEADGYPVEKCPNCGRNGMIIYSEGEHGQKHFPLGQCVYCGEDGIEYAN